MILEALLVIIIPLPTLPETKLDFAVKPVAATSPIFTSVVKSKFIPWPPFGSAAVLFKSIPTYLAASACNEHPELKPAVKVIDVIDAIATKYGLTISDDFITLDGNTPFDSLYLWCSREKGYIVNTLKEYLIDWNAQSAVTGGADYINLTSNRWTGSVQYFPTYGDSITYYTYVVTITPAALNQITLSNSSLLKTKLVACGSTNILALPPV